VKVAVWLLSFGIGLGLILNVIHHGDPFVWEGFVFGLFGGILGVILYATDGRPLRTARRFAKRFGKPS
jgi:hypothetical protein